jgi:putative oxidoreductase
MSFSEMIAPLVGRWMLAWFFFNQTVYYGRGWNSTIADMQAQGVPVAPLILALALILIVMGAISLALGFHARHGALLLFTVTIIATFLLHGFWRLSDAGLRLEDQQIFARNIAICGGLLVMIGLGAGPLSFDNKAGGGKPKGKK